MGRFESIYLENKALNEFEIKQKKIILKSKMRKLMVVLTDKCNLRCIMCIRKPNDSVLPSEVLEQIRKIFPYLDFIDWQGGEVFLVDYFRDLLQEASRYPYIQQEINTNGTLITKEWAELIAKANVRLIFSIDSLTKKSYEYIRKGAQFEDVMRGVSLIKEARINYGKSRPLDFINIVVMRSNYQELGRFIDFALDHNFDGLNFMYMVGDLIPEENIFQPIDLKARDYLTERLPEIFNKAKDHGISIACEFASLLSDSLIDSSQNIINSSLSNNDTLSCVLPWMKITIDGSQKRADVYPECLCEKVVGDLFKNNLDEIWNNESMQLYRSKIISRTYENWCSEKCIKGLVNTNLLQGL